MSFAVIQTGGKQYKVQAGEILKVEKLENSKPETKVEFKEIIAYGDDKSIENKKDAIDPYAYSIALENKAMNNYWTEKIADVYLGYTCTYSLRENKSHIQNKLSI